MYTIDEKELSALRETILSKKYFRYQGKDVETNCSLFEKEFAEKIDTDYAIFLTSGTNALVLSLIACGVGPGDEVIIPAYTFIATCSAVVQIGAIPVVVNIDNQLTICPQEIEKAITDKTKAIIPVHMDGLACDMDSITKIAKKFNLYIIEDAAQAVGGKYQGKRLGSMGDFGCYSFNMDKIISCGEGGALVTNKKEYYEQSFIAHDTPCALGDTMKDSFTTATPFFGYSMRMSEISGALIRVQLSRLDTILEELKKRKNIWHKAFSALDFHIPEGHCIEGNCCTSFHIQFHDQKKCNQASSIFLANGVDALPLTIRPAHAIWQWGPMLSKKKFIGEFFNPFQHSSKKYNYSTALYLKTLDILTTTLKVTINYDLSIEETKILVDQLLEKITP